MKKVKSILQRYLPKLYHTLRWRIGHPANYARVTTMITQKYGRSVIEGPFRGMKYVDAAAGSAYIPKILGCYEAEMHHFIERIIESNYSVIIDVGCAEGYYAVGLAYRCPAALVYAFDGASEARQLCQTMAKLNGVENRLFIDGFCDSRQLQGLPTENTLLICDVDGYEVELLRPDLVPALKKMDILVELHEPLRPGITLTIISRFKETHEISMVDAIDRNPRQHPLVSFLSAKDQKLALTESRPPGQQYAFLAAKDRQRC